MKFDDRYSLILDGPRPEEIVLLQGRGCFWKNCTFCDYYLDYALDDESSLLNKKVLECITGETGRLTVLNSGSFFELSDEIQDLILEICQKKGIKDLSMEAHWAYRDKVSDLKQKLKALGIRLHPRIGIETFDETFREKTLKKGFGQINLEELFNVFDEGCLLYGVKGQDLKTLKNDLDIALSGFNQVYLNIYEPRTDLEGDFELIKEFKRDLYPLIKDNPKIKVMLNTTDLGVGD